MGADLCRRPRGRRFGPFLPFSRVLCLSLFLVSSVAAIKMSESEAKDAFIIFDESYEGNDVDAHYLADILRAVGCNVSNAAAVSHGWTEAVGEKRITFDDFSATILPAVKADLSSTGCKEDEVEGLMKILSITEDDDGFVLYDDFITSLLSKC